MVVVRCGKSIGRGAPRSRKCPKIVAGGNRSCQPGSIKPGPFAALVTLTVAGGVGSSQNSPLVEALIGYFNDGYLVV